MFDRNVRKMSLAIEGEESSMMLIPGLEVFVLASRDSVALASFQRKVNEIPSPAHPQALSRFYNKYFDDVHPYIRRALDRYSQSSYPIGFLSELDGQA